MDLETEYKNKFNDFVNKFSNDKYIFEINKLCGYGEFLFINKRETLLDLYKAISIQFECKDIKELFFINISTNEKIRIPVTNEITIYNFLFSHNSGPIARITPKYPMPCKVVYQIYFDDGHTHGCSPCAGPIVTNIVT